MPFSFRTFSPFLTLYVQCKPNSALRPCSLASPRGTPPSLPRQRTSSPGPRFPVEEIRPLPSISLSPISRILPSRSTATPPSTPRPPRLASPRPRRSTSSRTASPILSAGSAPPSPPSSVELPGLIPRLTPLPLLRLRAMTLSSDSARTASSFSSSPSSVSSPSLDACLEVSSFKLQRWSQEENRRS